MQHLLLPESSEAVKRGIEPPSRPKSLIGGLVTAQQANRSSLAVTISIAGVTLNAWICCLRPYTPAGNLLIACVLLKLCSTGLSQWNPRNHTSWHYAHRLWLPTPSHCLEFSLRPSISWRIAHRLDPPHEPHQQAQCSTLAFHAHIAGVPLNACG